MVGIKETAPLGARTDIHLVVNWAYLGTVDSEEALWEKLAVHAMPVFDLDVYKILRKHLAAGKLQVIPLRGHQ